MASAVGFILAYGIDDLPLTLWLSFSNYKRVSTWNESLPFLSNAHCRVASERQSYREK
jgi:hypothetical protein